MKLTYLQDKSLPEILRKFLIYTQTIQNKSNKTTEEYYLDLRLYFRFLRQYKENLNIAIDEVDISMIDLNFIEQITIEDTYEFLAYLANDRIRFHKSTHSALGISSTSRSRKISSIRSFFKYLVDKTHMLKTNPIANLDFPSKPKSLPKYLTLDQSTKLIESIDGQFKLRDTCIILLFLSCGLRVSELVSINIHDISDVALRIRGKGNKERVVYLNELCLQAIDDYLNVRFTPKEQDKHALFISRQGNRINVQTVKWLVKKYALVSGIGSDGVSAHKLRHTAATLMYANGLDIRTLQQVLGHKNVDTTMIYTHINDENLRKASEINPISKLNLK